jgi:hypothetical protein
MSGIDEAAFDAKINARLEENFQIEEKIKKLSLCQKRIIAQMKKDNGSILVGPMSGIELQRRYNGVWDGEAIRQDTFDSLVAAGVIYRKGFTGGTTTPNSCRFEIWKLK